MTGRVREWWERAVGFVRGRREDPDLGRCCDCPYLPECTVCPVSIGRIPGDTDPDRVPDFLCAFNQVRVEHKRLFLAETATDRRAAE